ncbi:MAG: hypothetical protein ACI31G_01440 [Bacilli bacterium]
MKKTKYLLLISIFALAGCKQMPDYHSDSYSYIPPESVESENNADIVFDFSTNDDLLYVYNKIQNNEPITFSDLTEKIFTIDYKYNKINENLVTDVLYYETINENTYHTEGSYKSSEDLSITRNDDDYSLLKEVSSDTITFEVVDDVEIENSIRDNFTELVTLDSENETVIRTFTYEDSSKNKTEESDFIYSNYYNELNLIKSYEIFDDFIYIYELLSASSFDEENMSNNSFAFNDTITEDKAKIKCTYLTSLSGFQEKEIFVCLDFELVFNQTDLLSINYSYKEGNETFSEYYYLSSTVIETVLD